MSVVERIDPAVRREHEYQAMQCRADRHWWLLEESAPPDWSPSPLFLGAKNVVHHQCQRCGAWRHKAFNHLGTEPITRYVWPDWYQRKGEGRISGPELRLWQAKETRRKRRARKGAA